MQRSWSSALQASDRNQLPSQIDGRVVGRRQTEVEPIIYGYREDQLVTHARQAALRYLPGSTVAAQRNRAGFVERTPHPVGHRTGRAARNGNGDSLCVEAAIDKR